MNLQYDRKKFANLGSLTQSGHEVYPKATYGDNKNRVILKINKHGNSQFSYLEVAFSKVAGRFFANNTSANVALVYEKDPSNVVGIGVEHQAEIIMNHEAPGTVYYKYDSELAPDKLLKFNKKTDDVDDLVKLLDRLPHCTFSKLLQDDRFVIDYDSLASLLTASYTLEEDDLHKGNFGFYIVEKDGKKCVKFFKIDHDLMFVESVMSFVSQRVYHLSHQVGAFAITPEDLRDFPLLKHSSNGYWPAKSSYLANPLHSKDFFWNDEINAFRSLSTKKEFVDAKWFYFLKHILISEDRIREALKECFDETKPSHAAQIAMVTQAVVSRQAALRAALLSMPDFRNYVKELSSEKQALLAKELGDDSHLLDKLAHYNSLSIVDGDSPLHVAIKLGDYRYEETLRMFGRHINDKNSKGLTPLDVAYEAYKNQDTSKMAPIGSDYPFIMRHLISQGAPISEKHKNELKKMDVMSCAHKAVYLTKICEAKTYGDMKAVLKSVGEDCHYSLKGKKNLALECIDAFIEKNKTKSGLDAILKRLKNDINGTSNEESQAPLKYIRQLRSKLWLIRQIRGLYAGFCWLFWTSTQAAINQSINNQLEHSKPRTSCGLSFFQNGSAENSDCSDDFNLDTAKP